jgi:hypothetical protein
MKKNIAIIVLAISALFASCRPEKIKPYESAGSNGDIASLATVWTGSSAMQTDNNAVNKNFPYKTLDISQALQIGQWKLTLNAAGNTPGVFTMEYGTAPSFFKFSSGNWKVDDAIKAGKVYLINDAGTDTLSFTLGSYQNLLNNKLVLTTQKFLLGKPAVTYEYTFVK